MVPMTVRKINRNPRNNETISKCRDLIIGNVLQYIPSLKLNNEMTETNLGNGLLILLQVGPGVVQAQASNCFVGLP